MLLKVSKTFLYISVLSVLVVMTSTFFPFIGGKYYFFRFSIELAVIFLFFWWAFEAKEGEVAAKFKRVYTKPLFVAVSLFVLAFLLASIFANDPHAAFWSNYERGEGGFQMLHYYALFVLAAVLLEKKEDWEMMFAVSLGASVLMILYGVFGYYQQYSRTQHVGQADYAAPFCYLKQYPDGRRESCLINFITPYQGGGIPKTAWDTLIGARFQGTLGNPAYVAPYLLFSIFYAAYFWFSRKLKNVWANASLFGGLIAFFLFFFLLTQTRGAFLGLGASVCAFFVYTVFSMQKFRKQVVIAFVAVALIGGSLVYFKDSPFVKSIPGSRIFEISFSEDTVSTRLWTWGSAWSGFKERPILGWGPENFSAVFDKYFDTRHFTPGKNSETWFDRAHSVVFDYLAETGIVGFLAYMSMFVVLYWEMWKVFKKEHVSNKAIGPTLIRAAMVGLPIGYLVQGLVLFDVLPIYMNLFLFFGFAFYYFYSTPRHAQVASHGAPPHHLNTNNHHG